MECIKCDSETFVKNSRGSDTTGTSKVDKYTIYRRRECRACGHRFSTIEIPHEHLDKLEENFLVEAQVELSLVLNELTSRLKAKRSMVLRG